MRVELIAVIEIGYNNQDVPVPDKYPYLDNPKIWNDYNDECYLKAGFKDKFTPYSIGSSFYRLSDISDSNLTKLVIDHTQEMRDGKFTRERACSFFGGYVLKVNGQDKYFPQCCGDLGDIHYWESLSDGQNAYYSGHPQPMVYFKDDKIIFDFTVEDDGCFFPPPQEPVLTIDKCELKKTVEQVKKELRNFEQRINVINQKEKLNIDNIGELLIWGNRSL